MPCMRSRRFLSTPTRPEQRVIETLSRVALAGQARRVADALENLEDLLVEYASGQGL